MKYKETILIILIIINIVLGITLGIKNNKYKVLSEDDKKYIETITQLKQEQKDLNIQISNKNNELSIVNNKINQQNKILNGTAKYIMKINISQTHLTLSVSEHLKDAMNDIDIYIEVSEEYYNKYNVGDTIADDFRVGSMIFKGSFGNWKVKVADKQIV